MKEKTIKCDVCPRCKDIYPDRVDAYGYPFKICGMGGNIVYTIPRKEKRYNGNGYIYRGVDGCGLYKTVEDALKAMTEIERKRWMDEQGRKKKVAETEKEPVANYTGKAGSDQE